MNDNSLKNNNKYDKYNKNSNNRNNLEGRKYSRKKENERNEYSNSPLKYDNKNSNIRNNIENEIDFEEKKNKNNENKFDLKKLYKYPSKRESIEEQEKKKYRDSKYISTKYKDYLHSGNNFNKVKNRNSNNNNNNNKNNFDDNINNIYKEIQKNIVADEILLKKLEKRDYSVNNKIRRNNKLDKYNNNQNINNNSINRNISYDKLRDMNISINSDNSSKKKKFEDSLFKNGFFIAKNKNNYNKEKSESEEQNKYLNKENDESEEQSKGHDKINKIYEKYQKMKEKENEDYNRSNNKSNKGKNLNNNDFDYIKKIKGNIEELYGNSIFQDNIKNSNTKKKDFDEEYDKLFHPNNFKRSSNSNDHANNHLNTSDYSNSVYNLLNNLDNNKRFDYNNYGYDDLINSINEPKTKKIPKRNISTTNDIRLRKRDRKSYLKTAFNDENKNKSYILAPMKGIPITNISFRARMKYYSDRKEKNLEKLLKEKKEKEKQKCTFEPKIGDNSLKVIKYNNMTEIENNNKKRKVNYDRINNLYLDYKDKDSKIDELTKEYYKTEGISFQPKINDKNQEMKQFKEKYGQIPYLDRLEIYNAGKQPTKTEKIIKYYQTDLY